MSEHPPGTPEHEVEQVLANLALDGVRLTAAESELLLRYARGELTRAEYDARGAELAAADHDPRGGRG